MPGPSAPMNPVVNDTRTGTRPGQRGLRSSRVRPGPPPSRRRSMPGTRANRRTSRAPVVLLGGIQRADQSRKIPLNIIARDQIDLTEPERRPASARPPPGSRCRAAPACGSRPRRTMFGSIGTAGPAVFALLEQGQRPEMRRRPVIDDREHQHRRDRQVAGHRRPADQRRKCAGRAADDDVLRRAGASGSRCRPRRNRGCRPAPAQPPTSSRRSPDHDGPSRSRVRGRRSSALRG